MAHDDKNGGPNHVKAWRVFRGMTQADLAEAVGTNSNMIGYLESGERALSLKWLRRLAAALDTTVGMIDRFDPNDLDSDIIEIWATASTRNQRKIVEVAKLMVAEEDTKPMQQTTDKKTGFPEQGDSRNRATRSKRK